MTVVLASIVVQGQQVEVEDDLPELDIRELPEEPPIEGGVLSTSEEARLEARPSDSLPYDDSPIDGNCIPSYNWS